MSTFRIDSLETTARSIEFRNRVVKAARDHLRITEPEWDLYDVKVREDSHPIEGPRVAVTLYFKDNLMEVLR